jgi:hypothetical protein
MNQAEILKQLKKDLTSTFPQVELVSLNCNSSRVYGIPEIKSTLAELTIKQGWIIYPSQLEIISDSQRQPVSHPPLEADLVTDRGTVCIRHLNNDEWQVSEYCITPQPEGSDEVTHLASDYQEKMLKGHSGYLNYKRLWHFHKDKGMYIETAVLQGFSEVKL